MDPYSSGEDLVIKIRKPYTITKQRERWTEEEHSRFLEALRLYGRAWQRIEEHIGTKTAVQIRSHAQKFFTKLEKEAVVKGIPIGKSLDIEIPPPRPKRKPNNPYPRKTSGGLSASQAGVKDGKISNLVSSSCQSKVTVEHEFCQKPSDDEKVENSKAYHEKDNCFEAFIPLKKAPCASPSSTSKVASVPDASKNPCTFRQYVPLSGEAVDQDETAASRVSTELIGSQMERFDNQQPFQDKLSLKISNVADPYILQEKNMHVEYSDELKHSENDDTLTTADVATTQNYPRHVPVHILDGSQDISHADSVFRHMGGTHAHHAASGLYDNASKSSVSQSFPSYHHPVFAPVQSQDEYQSFMHVSATFSNLIVSALSQNPVAYAAASLASSFWPSVNVEASNEPSTASAGAFQSRQVTATPNMGAIAAATVAAATAWWAAHGLLPLCAPYHPGLTSSPASASTAPMSSNQGRGADSERKESSLDPALGGQQLEPECSETLQDQGTDLKSPMLSSSDSEESEGVKLNVGLAASETAKVEVMAEPKNKKVVDRSSCGSNTPSSSEVEADAMEKHADGKEKEEMEENDPFNRRCRSTTNVGDSWKEVSQEGRLTFQALFSRGTLPQSFSPPHAKGSKKCVKESERAENNLQLDLNMMTWGGCAQKKDEEDCESLNKEEEALNIGLRCGKLKARRTGFKPYKRCSVEAKECRVSGNSHDEEKCPKRLRMEGEVST